VRKLQKSNSVLGFLAGILLLVLMGSYQAQAAWTKSEASRFKKLEKRIATLEEQIQSSLETLQTDLTETKESVKPAIYLADSLGPWEAVNFNFLSDSLGACPKWSRSYGSVGKTSTKEEIYICNMTALVRNYK
jgi:hypothetical protein